MKKIILIITLFILIFTSSCSNSSTNSNVKYINAIESVLLSLDNSKEPNEKRMFVVVEKSPNPSLAKAMKDILELPYYFFQTNALLSRDLSLAFCSEANINNTKTKITTRCRYIDNNSSLGIYLSISIDNDLSYFYLDGVYDDNNKTMSYYSLYAADNSNQVNQYLEKNYYGFINITNRSNGLEQYDHTVEEFYNYLNEKEPIPVEGALLEAYKTISSKEEDTDTNNNFSINVQGNIELKAYTFKGEESTDFSNPLPCALEEDISKQNLFKGTLFHTYAYMENHELKDITDTCASLTAFFYIRVLDKKSISISLEAKDDIDARAIKYVMFDNDVLISSPRGETISNIPPDWNENEPFRIVSSFRSLGYSNNGGELIIWLDGNYIDKVPTISLDIE